MMKIILVIICFSSALCFGQTQLDLNDSAANEFKKADKELNKVYQQIIIENKDDTILIKNLKISERIWMQFRDAEMKVKYPDRESGFYGSVHPMCWYLYEATLTNERIKKLKELFYPIIDENNIDVCQ